MTEEYTYHEWDPISGQHIPKTTDVCFIPMLGPFVGVMCMPIDKIPASGLMIHPPGTEVFDPDDHLPDVTKKV